MTDGSTASAVESTTPRQSSPTLCPPSSPSPKKVSGVGHVEEHAPLLYIKGSQMGTLGGLCTCVCVCVPMGACVLMGGWVCLGVVSTRPSLLRVLLRPCVLTTTACCSQLLCLRSMFVHSVLFRTTDSQPYQELYASAEKKNPLTITTQSNDHY